MSKEDTERINKEVASHVHGMVGSVDGLLAIYNAYIAGATAECLRRPTQDEIEEASIKYWEEHGHRPQMSKAFEDGAKWALNPPINVVFN